MSAKDIILKAVSCEKSGYILEAQQLFEDAIRMLRKLVTEEKKPTKKETYNQRIEEYVEHVREIQEQLQRHTINSKLIDQIHVVENSRGNSYQKLFGSYLNTNVKEVVLYEPYLTERFHFKNLICFLELLVKNCRMLKYIRVVTKMDAKSPKNQASILKHIKADLLQGGITLNYNFDNTLHDRKILLSNGIIIKIGRGLHIYQPIDPAHSLGLCDFDFRRCMQTDVDIWRAKPFSDNSEYRRDDL